MIEWGIMKFTIVTTEEATNNTTITFVKELNEEEIIEELRRKMCFVEKRFKMFGCYKILNFIE